MKKLPYRQVVFALGDVFRLQSAIRLPSVLLGFLYKESSLHWPEVDLVIEYQRIIP